MMDSPRRSPTAPAAARTPSSPLGSATAKAADLASRMWQWLRPRSGVNPAAHAAGEGAAPQDPAPASPPLRSGRSLLGGQPPGPSGPAPVRSRSVFSSMSAQAGGSGGGARGGSGGGAGALRLGSLGPRSGLAGQFSLGASMDHSVQRLSWVELQGPPSATASAFASASNTPLPRRSSAHAPSGIGRGSLVGAWSTELLGSGSGIQGGAAHQASSPVKLALSQAPWMVYDAESSGSGRGRRAGRQSAYGGTEADPSGSGRGRRTAGQSAYGGTDADPSGSGRGGRRTAGQSMYGGLEHEGSGSARGGLRRVPSAGFGMPGLNAAAGSPPSVQRSGPLWPLLAAGGGGTTSSPQIRTSSPYPTHTPGASSGPWEVRWGGFGGDKACGAAMVLTQLPCMLCEGA
jgi:hypothetical protein